MSTKGLGIGVSNTGTVSGVAGCIEYGNPINHTTHFDLDLVDAITLANGADIADGVLVYTFPAGNIMVHSCQLDMSVAAADSLLAAGATITGVGTVIATGAVSDLVGTGTFEDILLGITQTADGTRDIEGSDDVGFAILSTAAHTVHVNTAFASTAAAGTDLSADYAGDMVLNWSICPTS